MGWFTPQSDPLLSARLARLERKLDALMAHLEVELPDDGLDDIREIAAAGNKILAIREYRARTGAGLLEAKLAVDAMAGPPGAR